MSFSTFSLIFAGAFGRLRSPPIDLICSLIILLLSLYDFRLFSSASFIKANSLSESHYLTEMHDSINRDSTDADVFGPLGNVRYLRKNQRMNQFILVIYYDAELIRVKKYNYALVVFCVHDI